MNRTSRVLAATLSLLATAIVAAQAPAPAQPFPEGTTRASTDVVGQDWPRVDAQRRVYFRIRAPEAQSIRVLGTNLTKGEDGFFTGVTAPQDPGFHYYQLTVDGLAVADPNSESFYGAGNVRSGIKSSRPAPSSRLPCPTPSFVLSAMTHLPSRPRLHPPRRVPPDNAAARRSHVIVQIRVVKVDILSTSL